jgi:DNA-binding IclR family transcriptional regulator
MPPSTRKTAKKKESVTREPAKKPPARDQYFSRAVSKALEALEVLQGQPESMALNDIAAHVQLSKTSAFRLLRTLETLGYVTSSGWGKYALAPGVQSVVSTQWLVRLMRHAMPRIQDLSREFHETASLAALFDNRVEVVAVVESPQILRMSNIVGHIVPPNASSLGKAVIAFQSEDRIEKLLRSYGIHRFTEHTIVDRSELFREFEQVRRQGFATDREESVPDGNCFGIPILGEGREVTAAISVSMPKARLRDSAHERAIVEALTEASSRISKELLQAMPAAAGERAASR